MGQKDIAEKTFEAYNDVFTDIVNGFLFQGESLIQEKALTDAQPFSVYKADGKLHQMERDIAKYWNHRQPDRKRTSCKSRRRIYFRVACLGIENQTNYDRDMPLRVIGYDGAAYRAELLDDRKERYPVITLVLYFGEKRWGQNRSLYDVLEVPEKLRPYVYDYGINVFEVSYLTEEQINWFHSDFRIAADYFAHKRTDPDYRPKDAQAIQHVDEFFKFMAVMTKDDRFAEEVEWEGSEPKTMDKFLDGVEAKGEKIGEERGKRIGIVNERERFATDMLQDGKPLDEIRKYSRLSESAIRKLAESMGVSVL